MRNRHLTWAALAAACAVPAILIGCATAPGNAEVTAKATTVLKASFNERGQAKHTSRPSGRLTSLAFAIARSTSAIEMWL